MIWLLVFLRCKSHFLLLFRIFAITSEKISTVISYDITFSFEVKGYRVATE